MLMPIPSTPSSQPASPANVGVATGDFAALLARREADLAGVVRDSRPQQSQQDGSAAPMAGMPSPPEPVSDPTCVGDTAQPQGMRGAATAPAPRAPASPAGAAPMHPATHSTEAGAANTIDATSETLPQTETEDDGPVTSLKSADAIETAPSAELQPASPAPVLAPVAVTASLRITPHTASGEADVEARIAGGPTVAAGPSADATAAPDPAAAVQPKDGAPWTPATAQPHEPRAPERTAPPAVHHGQASLFDGEVTEVRQAPDPNVTPATPPREGVAAADAGPHRPAPAEPQATESAGPVMPDATPTPASVAAPAPPPNAAAATSTATLAPASPPLAAQIAPVVLAQATRPGAPTRVVVALRPEALGGVQVAIEGQSDGPAKVRILAERVETLALLLRDRPALEQALQAAGVETRPDTLSFGLSDQASHEDRQPREQLPRASSRRGLGATMPLPFTTTAVPPPRHVRGLLDLAL